MPGYDGGAQFNSGQTYDANFSYQGDMPKKSDYDLVQRLQQLFRQAKQAKSDRYEGWDRNTRLVHNKIGGRTALAASTWPPSPRDSEIYPMLSSIVAWMADQHTIIDISPATDPGSPFYSFIVDIANDLGTTMQSNWQVEDEETQIKLVIWDALVYGVGYFKSVWDQGLAGGLGNAKAVRVDPYALYIDPNATRFDNIEYIVEARKMSLNEIERRWPGTSAAVEARVSGVDALDQRPSMNSMTDRIPKANPGNLPSGNGRWGGVSNGNQYNASSSVIVYEFWIKENDEWYEDTPDYNEKHVRERWRVCVMAANEILMDEYADSLFRFNTHPYDCYMWDDIGEAYGISLVDHLAYPQIYINRLLSALQANAEMTGNPIFLESSQSGLDRVAIINRPGQRLRVQGTAGMQNKPDWLQPPSMPPQVKELIEFWIQRMENIAGLSAASKGNTSASNSRTSDQVMNTIQEAAFVRVRSAIANLERTLIQVGYKLADLVIDNYTVDRVVAIAGPKGEKTALALKPRHFMVPTEEGQSPLKYVLNINAGSALPTSRQARAQQADRAYALGLYDRQAWYEANQIPNWQILLDRINQQIATGTFTPPGSRQKSQRKQ